jgi:ABC-type antimicrobial peptide transport system permease subunit
MKAIPFSYIARNVYARRVTTLLTAGGMALVVFVFASALMMTEGIRATLVATGQPDNVIVIRKAAGTEVQSGVGRDQGAIIESIPEIATDGDGAKLVSKEPVAIINMPKRKSNADDPDKPANIVVRGTTAAGFAMRPQVHIVEGRTFTPGTSEIIAGRSIARGFTGAGLGESLRFAQRQWTVVGVFDAGGSAFDSEVWGDAEQLMQGFRRQSFSAVIFRLADPSQFARVKADLEADPRLTVEAKPEKQFYAEQSESLAKFIGYLGTTLSVIFSIGAIVGAMITMYASVAARTGEIGTLRALGFPRSSILVAFLVESLVMGLVGGVLGLAAASAMQAVSLSTINFQTFSELTFRFRINGAIVVEVLAFALFMGFVGGFLPAFRAARMKIVDALRAA